MYWIVKVYSFNASFGPKEQVNWNERVSENGIIFIGVGLLLAGIVLSLFALFSWKRTSFGDLEPERIMRIVIPAVTMLELGVQNICIGFVIGIIKIRSVKS